MLSNTGTFSKANEKEHLMFKGNLHNIVRLSMGFEAMLSN